MAWIQLEEKFVPEHIQNPPVYPPPLLLLLLLTEGEKKHFYVEENEMWGILESGNVSAVQTEFKTKQTNF